MDLKRLLSPIKSHKKVAEKIWDLENENFQKIGVFVYTDYRNNKPSLRFSVEIQKQDLKWGHILLPEEIGIEMFNHYGVEKINYDIFSLFYIPLDAEEDKITNFYYYLILEVEKYIKNIFRDNELDRNKIERIKEAIK